ncbi:MAG: zinc metallopeptidase [Acidobacteria bacterium]|nr:zinc metallopeptidase [Acidobacteriota bacterium]
MRWQQGRRSKNVEDRRRNRAAPKIGLAAVVIALIAVFMGADPDQVLGLLSDQQVASQSSESPYSETAAETERADFVSAVLADTEDTWHQLFDAMNRRYEEPTLVLFRDAVRSGCGAAQSSTGPFYCPADHKMYLDLDFFDDLSAKLGAPGDFAQAYVIAHEVGHHVQNLLGTSSQVHQMRTQLSETEYNQLSVKLELQADFYAGVWAHYAQRARQLLERGDLEEAINAASAIGDDRLQRQAQGYVVPDAFTHGTSEQRMRWFKRGFETGDMAQGDTFTARNL